MPGSRSNPTYSELNARAAGNAAGRMQPSTPFVLPVTASRAKDLLRLNAPKIAGQSTWYLTRQLNELQERRSRRQPDDTVRQANGADGCDACP